jgi:hypothetical protein
VVQDEQGISDFEALRSAIHKAPHRLVFFAFDLLHLDGQDLRRTPLIETRASLRKLIEPDPRPPIQFRTMSIAMAPSSLRPLQSLGWRALCLSGQPACIAVVPRSTKNMVEGER